MQGKERVAREGRGGRGGRGREEEMEEREIGGVGVKWEDGEEGKYRWDRSHSPQPVARQDESNHVRAAAK